MTSRPIIVRAASLALAGVTRGALPLCFGVAALAPLAAAQAQQIKPVEPYFVTVTKDSVPMKCSDGGIFYAVAVLRQGQVLRVDGEGPGWLRVEYLPGMKGYVKAAEATPDAAGKTIKLTRPTRLMAANVQGSSPWQPLLDVDVPAGTTYTVLDSVKSPDGAIAGYLVPAPAQARGYVKNDQVKRATPEEAAAYARTEAPRPPTPEPGRAEPTPTPGGDQAIRPIEPPVTPTQPAPAPEAEAARPVAAAPAAPEAPKLKVIKDLDVLRTLFNNVMRSPGGEEEIKTVMAEFERTNATLGASEDDQRIREALAQRKEALQLRLDMFELSRKVRDASVAWDEKESKLREHVGDVERQAIYTIVGRILPSTVYDGKRGMPLMYRVESADSSSTRTLGYVVPREGINLLLNSGKVVGIVGESRFDEALRMNIVAARRVTELSAGGRSTELANEPTNEPATVTGAAEKPGE